MPSTARFRREPTDSELLSKIERSELRASFFESEPLKKVGRDFSEGDLRPKRKGSSGISQVRTRNFARDVRIFSPSHGRTVILVTGKSRTQAAKIFRDRGLEVRVRTSVRALCDRKKYDSECDGHPEKNVEKSHGPLVRLAIFRSQSDRTEVPKPSRSERQPSEENRPGGREQKSTKDVWIFHHRQYR